MGSTIMARQTMLLMKGTFSVHKRSLVAIALSFFTIANAQPKIYVISDDWYLTIIDAQTFEVVDDFEIVDPRATPLETRTLAESPLLVPDKDLLFVGNTAGALPQNYSGGGLKIMKVDLKSRLSSPYFLDPPGPPPGLMGDYGNFYYDAENNIVYACYGLITYAIDLNGNITQEYPSPEGCPVQGHPRFGNKLYSLGKNRMSELNLADMKRRVVLKDLEYVGGTPFTGGDLWFISQDERNADLIIADRKTKRYQIEKPLPPEPAQWKILSEEDYSYDVHGEILDDVAGYKKFVGELLTIRPPSSITEPPPEEYKFWVFDATRDPMPVLYEVNLPSAEQVWDGDPNAPRDPFGPTPYLIPGTGRIAALYTGLGDWRPVKLLIVDASTGEKLKEFNLHAGIAGVAISE
jgi:hypothetical protein